MKTVVVIFFAEALSAPEAAWSLVDAGYDVVAVSRRGRRAALRHSSWVTVYEIAAPEADFAAALADLDALRTRLDPPQGQAVILPLDDTAVWLCDRLEHKSKWVIAGPQGKNAVLALDKEIQVQAARAAGLTVPATTIARTPAEVMSRSAELPLVLRPAQAILPRDGRLQKGRNWICANVDELRHAIESWGAAWPLLVQPFVYGTGEGVFGLASSEGVEAWSAHRRVRMMNPHGSGSSACISQPLSGELKQAAERLIKQTGWRGLFMIEMLRDDAGTPWFVELNGRPWGSMALSRRQGLEYPAWAAMRALDPVATVRIPIMASSQQAMLCRNVGREFMHFLFVLRGPKSQALKDWPSSWKTLLALLSVRRRDSVYNWRRDDLKVFFSDFWYTLRGNFRKSNG